MNETAINTAQNLIKKHKVSIPVDLVALLKKLGISLNVSPLESMSGFAYQKDGRKVIGVNQGDGAHRQRFTIAHELGHMLLHANSDVLFDRKNDFVYFRDGHSSTGQNVREVEANAFAAELLMPSSDLRDRISKIGGVDLMADEHNVKKLAKHYEVSFMAMSVRIDSLAKHSI